METILRPCAAVADASSVLYPWQQALGSDGFGVVKRVGVGVPTLNFFWWWEMERIECYEDVSKESLIQML